MNFEFLNTSLGNYGFNALLDAERLPLDHSQDDNCEFCFEGEHIALMDAAITHVEEVTTGFTSETLERRVTLSTAPAKDEYAHAHETIMDFLGKPYRLDTVSWNTAMSANQNLANYNVENTLTGLSIWQNKFQGFNLIRASAVLRVQINANPFQQGRLLVHFVPGAGQRAASNTTMYNISLTTKTQHPHVEIGTGESSCVLQVPYVAPTYYFDLSTVVTGTKYGWGTFHIDVLSPLKTGASGTTTVDVTTWMHFTDVELAAPSIAQSRVTGRVNKEEDAMDSGRPISSALRLTAKAADTMAKIPIVRTYAEPVAWAARAASGVAASLGFSKPGMDGSFVNVNPNPYRYMATSEGHDPGVSLSLSYDNKLQLSDSISGRAEDEMSFEFLKRVPALLSSVDWNTSDSVGVALYDAAVGVPNLYQTGTSTAGTHTFTWRVGPPIWYLSNMFTAWRGGLKLRIKFIKTQFHTGRLDITWTPGMSVSAGPNLTSSTLSLREIVDLKFQDEVVLDLPFLVAPNFLGMGDTSGWLKIVVLNELKAPETVSSNVQALFFWSGADDFELAAPVLNTSAVATAPFIAFGDVPELNTTVGDQIAPTLNVAHDLDSMGEHFSSVKQLLNRYHKLYQKTALTSNGGLAVYPFIVPCVTGDSTGEIYPNFGGDRHALIMAMYGYFRGGARVMTHNSTSGPEYFKKASLSNVSAQTNVIENAGGNAQNITTYSWGTQGTKYMSSANYLAQVNPASGVFKVPYYCDTRSSLVRLAATDLVSDNTGADSPYSALTVTSSVATTVPFVLRSFAEDFQLGYFICAPPLLSTMT